MTHQNVACRERSQCDGLAGDVAGPQPRRNAMGNSCTGLVRQHVAFPDQGAAEGAGDAVIGERRVHDCGEFGELDTEKVLWRCKGEGRPNPSIARVY